MMLVAVVLQQELGVLATVVVVVVVVAVVVGDSCLFVYIYLSLYIYIYICICLQCWHTSSITLASVEIRHPATAVEAPQRGPDSAWLGKSGTEDVGAQAGATVA